MLLFGLAVKDICLNHNTINLDHWFNKILVNNFIKGMEGNELQGKWESYHISP